MHLILTGATGLVGSAVLNHILSLPASSQITRLSILSRRPVPSAQAQQPSNPNLKIEVITHSDFDSYPSTLLSQLKGANGVIWALGVSQTEVSRDEYVKITKDYALSAAKAFSTLPNSDDGDESSSKINFVYVSGEGATLNPSRFSATFARVKGETERELVQLSQQAEYKSLRVYNARPGGVDPRQDPATQEAAANRSSYQKIRRYGIIIYPVIATFYRSMHSPTKDLARALTDLAVSDGKPLSGKGIEEVCGEGRIVTNVGLRRLAGLH